MDMTMPDSHDSKQAHAPAVRNDDRTLVRGQAADSRFDRWLSRRLHEAYDNVLKEQLPAELERLVQQLAEQPAAPTTALGTTSDGRGQDGGRQELPCRSVRADPRRAVLLGLGSVSFLRS
jgi:hypothetical protein